MPGGDGTGPQGLGSMTGRAAGYCAGYTSPGFANPVPGRGFGMGFGGGFGHLVRVEALAVALHILMSQRRLLHRRRIC